MDGSEVRASDSQTKTQGRTTLKWHAARSDDSQLLRLGLTADIYPIGEEENVVI